MTEHEQLAELCERLGAAPGQAAIMAAQLLKRAEQLAIARGISREAALKGLLDVLIHGRAGAVAPGFEPPPGPPDVSSPRV